MNVNMKKIAFGLLLAGGVTGHALAAGTTAGSTIENGASLSFQTSTGQTLSIDSSPTGNSNTDGTGGATTDFVVDRKLDIEVVKQDAELVSVAPDGTAYLTFDVTNNGNDVQDVLLTAASFATNDADTDVSAATGGGPDDNDALSFKVCDTLPAGGPPVDCSAVTSLDNLAEDETRTVYILAVMKDDTAVDNGNLVLFSLMAQVADGTSGSAIASDDSGTADDPSVVQNVFADAAGPGTDGAGDSDAVYDGFHSDAWAFLIIEANVTVTKTAVAVWDPFSCDDDADPSTDPTAPTSHTVTGCTGTPKAIPGAYLEYTITITNATNAADAEDLVITDLIDDTEVSFVTDAYDDDGGLACAGGCGIYVVQPYATGGAEPAGEAHTNDGGLLDPDDSDFGDTTANTVTSSPDNLAGGETTTVKFRVEIQ